MNPGEMLLHYRIHERIGSGGMGDVYRALDTKLERTVAIKLLPRDVANDLERRRRFVQEARAASALEHPNIATVFDIAESEGRQFIVMQYVSGKSLGDLLRGAQGGLPLSKVLDLAVQISDGLAAAHARGIVHRDLKPDNVVVQETGGVKILDWGLAKLVEPENLTEAATREKARPLTESGLVVGTPAYMSPEQVQGRSIDSRSDVFSFGSVLFEMVTGRKPFAGETPPLLMASIVRDQPPAVSELSPSVPSDLEKLITRALRKEPEWRWQSMADVRVALAELKRELETGKSLAVRPSKSRWPWIGVAGVMVALAAGGLLWWGLSRSEPLPPLKLVPLTALPGNESYPALSPDAKQVAFAWKDEGADNYDLYVKLIEGGEQLRLTETPEDEFLPTWSPDGTRIAFLRHHVKDDNDTLADGIHVISALGGQDRPVGKALSQHHGLSWSPDGKVLAILDKESYEDPDAIYLLSIDTGEKRRLTDPPRSCTFDSRFCGEWTPAFSPDGRWIAFFRTNDRQILRVPVQGGEPSPITRPAGWAFTLAWTRDGTGLIFSGSSEYGPFKLWRVSSSGGDAEPLPITDDALRPTLSRVGSRMVYVKDLSDTNLWAIDGPKAKQKKGPRKLIASTQDEYGFDVSPDGKRIAFSSARTGAADIWVADSEGRDPVQLTFLGEAVGADYPQWSPDGRWIAFSVWSPDSELDVYLVPTEGGAPRRLTEWPSRDMVASWSRDGKWIYFTSARSGPYETWKVRIDGGDPIQVTHTGGVGARESPDGRFLFVMKVGSPAILRLSMENGEEEKLIDRNGWPFDVSDEGIVFVDSPGGEKPAIRYYEFSTGKVSTVAVLENAPQISVSPDGEWIVYDQQDVTGSDLVLVENFR